ncbi:winged helix-turn-helix transcriptional regulator [Novosphingobium sp. JCM 18896]|uniref:winged helix-turn-helix transcriptional regulator n=1 Tax=Novosphingobium sp. JCM 18896 TaxID=2989731 RepID=UPI0022223DDA|nr:helix-turn-helix domain-containing protein [Novosphingobium sp. JCM 18896]MCW1431237.1 helix-turn-helix transcriptional regulator [Novosphingobium sp. JCM 18896]
MKEPQKDGAKDAFALIERRWLLRIVACLIAGPRRFADLRAAMPIVSAKILTQRLEEMIEAGLVVRDRLSAQTKVQVYALTDKGASLEPAIAALNAWGSTFQSD